MASNGAPPAPLSTGAAIPTEVSLRIITLAYGSNRENDVSLVTSLDSTVFELKERLRQLVAGNPQHDQQRLIYQGRHLHDNNATLRSILRLSTADRDVHVLHLVIRSDASAPQSTMNPANVTPAATQHASATPVQDAQARPPPHMPPFPNLPNMFQPMMDPNQMAEQANIFQQHMAIHNQHLANLRQGFPHPPPNATNHVHGDPNLQHPAHLFPPQQAPTSYGNRAANGERQPATHNMHNSNQSTMTMRVSETIGPNGERVRVVTNSTGPAPHQRLPPGINTNPIERSASAPGSAERTETPASSHGQRAAPVQQQPIFPMLPTMPALGPRPMPDSAFSAHQPPPSQNPTVWILNSPTGPQALLFAPGHGYFSTTTMTATQPMTQQTQTSLGSGSIGQPQQPSREGPGRDSRNQPHGEQAQAAGVGPGAVAGQPGAGVVARPPNLQRALANAEERPAQPEGGEIAAFILQRGWLFLRLYMFIFVLSEPGTWRRIILLGIATLISFLPRHNPLTAALIVVRRYFDNLIGPPQLPARRPQQLNQPPGARAIEHQGRPGNNVAENGNERQEMPTPEENARRLLLLHQQQNPSLIRALLLPIEQAVTLFLASLIPGVGERHIEAREAARQLLAEEEQHRRQEAETQTTQQAERVEASPSQPRNSEDEAERSKNELAVSTSSAVEESQTSGSASAVEATTSTAPTTSSTSQEGIRQRSSHPVGESQEE